MELLEILETNIKKKLHVCAKFLFNIDLILRPKITITIMVICNKINNDLPYLQKNCITWEIGA